MAKCDINTNVFFSLSNINQIKFLLRVKFKNHFDITYIPTESDLTKVMHHVFSAKIKRYTKDLNSLNNSVVDYIFKDYQYFYNSTKRVQDLKAGYVLSQHLVDPTRNVQKYDPGIIKTTDQKKYNGQSLVGGTLQFYFT